jgi:hypothetical protein
MRRWVPFAIASFMLTPFALWLGLGLFGPGGAAVRIDTRLGAVLLSASLPLAGLFWIQNLRLLGDSIGAASRLRIAARLADLLPLAILGIGALGAAWLLVTGTDHLEPFLALLGTLAMAGFGWQIARSPVEPGCVIIAAPAQADDGEAGFAALIVLGNIALTLTLMALYWTPWVFFWAVLALVPAAFVLMVRLAWWAAQSDVREAPLSPLPRAPANDRGAGAKGERLRKGSAMVA